MTTAYEIATWLNEDATDEEFASVFALLGMMMNGRKIPNIYDNIDIIVNANYDDVWRRLNTICKEIQINIGIELKALSLKERRNI